ncbi:MAG: hypothetical protein LLG06_01330 [Desulfobacteraceae bacterium]|nr:hypothetical protein [Desulfobacteraceae bacterium]
MGNGNKRLQGKWLNREQDWALIFEGGKVLKYENGAVQNANDYVVKLEDNAIVMDVLDQGQTVMTYKLRFKSNDTLQIERAVGGEQLVPVKQPPQ